jgi:hypothetical protein
MKRRDFLTLCGYVAGACMIPGRLARAIRDTCVLGGQPYLINPPSLGGVIYAVQYGDSDFTLRYGEAVSPPTWREYLEENAGIDTRDKKAIKEWQRWKLGLEPGEEEKIVLGKEIDGGILSEWQDWDYAMTYSPEAQAFHYLGNLPLDDGSGPLSGDPLGKLKFIEGDRPGSNLTFVMAPDLATLACLQHRLNTLGENVGIEIQQEE